jgi:hypothetical protein
VSAYVDIPDVVWDVLARHLPLTHMAAIEAAAPYIVASHLRDMADEELDPWISDDLRAEADRLDGDDLRELDGGAS